MPINTTIIVRAVPWEGARRHVPQVHGLNCLKGCQKFFLNIRELIFLILPGALNLNSKALIIAVIVIKYNFTLYKYCNN